MSTKWDTRYLGLAQNVASWSKDPSRKVGAVAIGMFGQVLSQGYNGFPRGIQDSEKRLNDRPTKYRYVVHAEMNAIYNATFSGVSLAGSTMYVHGLPICSECAKGLIQVGIARVVVPKQDVPDNWKESCEFTKTLFSEAKVQLDEIEISQDHSGGNESGENLWEPVRITVAPSSQPMDGSSEDSDVLVRKQLTETKSETRRPRPEYFGLDKRLR